MITTFLKSRMNKLILAWARACARGMLSYYSPPVVKVLIQRAAKPKLHDKKNV